MRRLGVAIESNANLSTTIMEWDREDGTVADHYIWNTRKNSFETLANGSSYSYISLPADNGGSSDIDIRITDGGGTGLRDSDVGPTGSGNW